MAESEINFSASSDEAAFVTLSLVTELFVEVLTMREQLNVIEAQIKLSKEATTEEYNAFFSKQSKDNESLRDAMLNSVNERVNDIVAGIRQQLANQ